MWDSSPVPLSAFHNGGIPLTVGTRRLPSASAGTPVRWGKLSGRAKQQVESAERERTTMSRATSLAEARLADALKKKKFSYGDRLAYEAERAAFDPLPNRAACFYAVTSLANGDILIHGGQPTGANLLDPEMATSHCSLWATRGEHLVEEEVTIVNTQAYTSIHKHTYTCRTTYIHTCRQIHVQRHCSDSTVSILTDTRVVCANHRYRPQSHHLIYQLDLNPGPCPLIGHSAVCYKGSRVVIYGGCGPMISGLFSETSRIDC